MTKVGADSRRFVVAIRGDSGLAVRSREPIDVAVRLPEDRRVRLLVRSYRKDGVHSQLWIRAEGDAPDVRVAVEEFTREARNLCAMLSVAANGPIGHLRPELGYEVTEGVTERDFFQALIPEPHTPPAPGRAIATDDAHALVNAYEASGAARPRLARAIGHYHHALANWDLELVSAAHLFMAAEALAPVALGRFREERALDEQAVRQEWELEEHVPTVAGARFHLVFGADGEAYGPLKRASDGYEHSSITMDEARELATAVREEAASHVRRCILRNLDLPGETRARMLATPYDGPFSSTAATYVWGQVVGAGRNVAAEGREYPMLSWTSGIEQEGDERVVRYSLTPNLAPDSRFVYRGMEVWGGPPEKAGMGGEPVARKVSARGGDAQRGGTDQEGWDGA